MSVEAMKELLKTALKELADEGHHVCLVFRTPEEQQLARDVVKLGKMAKYGFMGALVLFLLGGAAIAFVGKVIGVIK